MAESRPLKTSMNFIESMIGKRAIMQTGRIAAGYVAEMFAVREDSPSQEERRS
jgi:hypothetical protein